MNELFLKEKFASTKNYSYFLKRHKKIYFSSCLFLIKFLEHVENLKYLFFFYSSIVQTNYSHANNYNYKYINNINHINHINHNSNINSLHNYLQTNHFINYNFICSKIGIKREFNPMIDTQIVLNNVNVQLKREILENLKNNKMLNKKQKDIITHVVNWFKYGGPEKNEKK